LILKAVFNDHSYIKNSPIDEIESVNTGNLKLEIKSQKDH